MNRVWNMTFDAGNIYDGLGPGGPTPEGFSKDLDTLWEYTWNREVDEDLKAAEQRLRDLGVFKAC